MSINSLGMNVLLYNLVKRLGAAIYCITVDVVFSYVMYCNTFALMFFLYTSN